MSKELVFARADTIENVKIFDYIIFNYMLKISKFKWWSFWRKINRKLNRILNCL